MLFSFLYFSYSIIVPEIAAGVLASVESEGAQSSEIAPTGASNLVICCQNERPVKICFRPMIAQLFGKIMKPFLLL